MGKLHVDIYVCIYMYMYVEHKGPQPASNAKGSNLLLVNLPKLLEKNPLERTEPSLAMNHFSL